MFRSNLFRKQDEYDFDKKTWHVSIRFSRQKNLKKRNSVTTLARYS